ncbi:OsmC family protein [Senegalia sp. (in: firmicutes)]|uniref:OsmC family protein n=1 Tax=Senegalia sp. (in: firmicutes) TaxID=1924098 RepID=UPI003F997E0C
MTIEVSKATSHLLDGVKVESSVREFKMILDEPEKTGGTNSAMHPVEALLCALGSCQSIITRGIAEKMGVEIEDLKIELEGKLDTRGFEGDTSIRPGLADIKSKFIIKSNESQEKINEMMEKVKEFCPVGDTVSNGTNLEVDYSIKK